MRWGGGRGPRSRGAQLHRLLAGELGRAGAQIYASYTRFLVDLGVREAA